MTDIQRKPPTQVVLIADEPEERDLYAYALRQAGLTVRAGTHFRSTIDEWFNSPADLLLMIRPDEKDLPKLVEGFRDISSAPLLLLLDAPSATTQLRCVQLGADLALSMPIDPRLLAAYCLSLIRRSAGLPASSLPTLQVGGLLLQPSDRSVVIENEDPIRLTQLEFQLLFLLMTHRGQVIPTDDLVERVWGYTESGSRELARGLVSRLRAKLGDSSQEPTYLETIPGVGYRLRDVDP
ncbi:MAG: response regulator transcription factor [Anaerolineales bacterium]